jgi:hypothetical protein
MSVGGDTLTKSGDIVCKTSTERSPNQAPFDKISKSGDGGGSGGSLGTKGGRYKTNRYRKTNSD